MRRTKPDLSYKKRTGDIIQSNFRPWQLTRKDEREGIHRLVNNVVSYIGELSSEVSYIENMFFPEQMDLSEEWVMYKTYPEYGIANLVLSGIPISGVCTIVTDTDNFISNGFDQLVSVSSFQFTDDILSIKHRPGYIDILSNRKIHTINTISEETSLIISADIITSGEINIVVGPRSRQFVFQEKIRPETVKVTYNGISVPFRIKNASEFTAPWVDNYDCDNNGIVGDYEEYIARLNEGKKATDHTPEEWAAIDWLDTDGNGEITDRDIEIVLAHINSVAPGTEHVIIVDGSSTGIMNISYEVFNPKATMFSKGDCQDRVITDIHPINTDYTSVTYDRDLDIFFGITKDKRTVRAFKYDFDNQQIKSDTMLYIPGMDISTILNDIDNMHGFLYILADNNGTPEILYDEIRTEYVESINRKASILVSGIPEKLAAGSDGSFIIVMSGEIITMSPERDRCIEINGTAYFNKKRNYTLSNSTPLNIVPSYIFNSFDSFAYSLGIERPYGIDNFGMRNIIRDFWKHQQDNSEYGMNYGIMREIGIIPGDLSYNRNVYSLPEKIIQSGNLWDITINEYNMNLISSGESLIFSGSPGILEIYNQNLMLFSESILTGNDQVSLSSFFEDKNGDPVYLEYVIPVIKGKNNPDISVDSYDDEEFLESIDFIISGEPTAQLIDFVRAAETSDPFIYKNAIVDSTPMDMKRITPDPVIPTVFDPVLSGILSGLVKVDITI